MSFGHQVDKLGEPRARHLRAFSAGLAVESGDDTYCQMSRRIEETVLAEKGLYPDVDYIGGTGQRRVAAAAR